MLQFKDDEGNIHELIPATIAAKYLKVTTSCIHYYVGRQTLRHVPLTGMRLVYKEDIETINQSRIQIAEQRAQKKAELAKEPEPAAA